ncbi:hypothetical protein A2U01_0020653, partial [Trifolium medium]|nr:hypothetical protein [Trifolium medium]
MATYNNGQFPANLPILQGKNYDSWSKQMKVLFNYQDVMDQVTNGVEPIAATATETERTQHKELKKKEFKALFIIHQSVSPDIFEKVGDCETAKEAWDILAAAYAGDQKVKKVKLQTLRRQFEQIQMEDKETVSDFFTRVAKLVNEMKACGEAVTTIEESKDLATMKVEELQGSLEAHEQRMNERNSNKVKGEVALQAQQNSKDKKGKGKWNGNKGRGGHNNAGNRDKPETSNASQKNENHRGGFNGNHRDGRG